MEYVESVNDPRLKPKLLRSLIRDRLPDENRPIPTPSSLSSVLSDVKTHGLLSESFHGPADPKLVAAWKSAVGDWVDHSLKLVSSKMPDKCWAGICLLGVTCEECSSDRFLSSYSDLFQKLMLNMQLPSDSHFIKVALCASFSDLFTRLAGFSNMKKEATSLAVKIVLPVLQLLTEDAPDTVWVEAVDLLCTLLTFFPSSVHRHYDKVEAVIVSKIISGKCSVNMSKKLASCLASLPKAKGDADSWSLMMRKILIAIDLHLDDAFQGLEEGKFSEIRKLLVPPGKEPPPPLGGHHALQEASGHMTKRLQELLVPRVSTLMHCCSMMLTNSYHIQVPISVHTLLAVVQRVLSVDGSLHESVSHFTTALHQELLCTELPALHLSSLDLLVSVIKGVRSQLLPHAANVVRFLTEYFRRATLPSIRIKVYSVILILLTSMGVGMALYLAQEIIENAFADLNISGHGSDLISPNGDASKLESNNPFQSTHRKRKHAGGPSVEHQSGVDIEEMAPCIKPVASYSVQIAALETLKALLTVGGTLRAECWRSNVELLLITVARNACDTTSEQRSSDSATTHADFQLAAFQALLASIISAAHYRPPYLSECLELFRRGKHETGTGLAQFCCYALMDLEVLIHPRGFPLMDLPAVKNSTFLGGFNHQSPESTFLGSEKSKMPQFTGSNRGVTDVLDVDDDMHDSWLVEREEAETNVRSDQDKHMLNNEECIGTSSRTLQENPRIPRQENPIGNSSNQDQDATVAPPIGDAPAAVAAAVGGLSSEEIVSRGEGETPSNALEFGTCTNDSMQNSATSNKEREMTMSYDSDSSLDPVPELVEGDPDSD